MLYASFEIEIKAQQLNSIKPHQIAHTQISGL